MRNLKTEGIIIRRRDFKDADRILTILTKDYGKIAVKASGIRRIPSRRSPHVELLNHCIVSLYQGNKFPILTEAHTLSSFSPVKEDLQRIGAAYHLCELVDGLCPENQENRAAFELMTETLHRLAKSTSDEVTVTVRQFEIEFLTLLGYWNTANNLNTRIDMDQFVEGIIERKLRSKTMFAKLI